MTINDTATLNNGVEMPLLGLGVFRSQEGDEVKNAIQYALDAGYRHVDTAKIYANERGVGQAVADSGIKRDEIFVTTKVWNSDQGYDKTLKACDNSLKRLGMDYVDLFLIHWPVKGKYKETWGAMEKIYEQGKARAIGISNFLPHHIEDILTVANVVPMVNQVEFHVHLQQPALQEKCKEHGIILEAWSPIKKGRLGEETVLLDIGQKYGVSPYQVALRWIIQKGHVAIPKSVRKERIEANADLYGFDLSEEDLARIDGMDRGERVGPDPDNFDF